MSAADLLAAGAPVTGIGSMPHIDADAACDLILKCCPDLPFWPQLVRVDARESMLTQFSEHLPNISLNPEHEPVYDSALNMEETATALYARISARDLAWFGMGPDYAQGFHALMKKAREHSCGFIKGQITGPITFLTSITGADGRFLIADEFYSEVLATALAMKALWQIHRIEAIGKKAVIFFDEPGLSAFGSAYMSVERSQVDHIYRTILSIIRPETDALLGMHCCGNTDWQMLLESGLDIISLDAFGYAERFVLYADAVRAFLEEGGLIAWGIVPSSGEGHTREDISGHLSKAFTRLAEKGVHPELIRSRALFTPACGLGNLDEGASITALETLGFNSWK